MGTTHNTTHYGHRKALVGGSLFTGRADERLFVFPMTTPAAVDLSGFEQAAVGIQADYERLLAELDASLAAHGITSH
ncbi:hypothetical protein [Nocardia wallacei]|uniref:hypothetical protein n=1 Tax=Nocardia wallacei TaxID=480035 RepID=UPI002457A7E1|nr:hypothetical protein [Nocardia wallacei]